MEKPVRSSALETFNIDRIDFVKHPSKAKSKQLKISSSISVEEFINLAMSYEIWMTKRIGAGDSTEGAATLDADVLQQQPKNQDSKQALGGDHEVGSGFLSLDQRGIFSGIFFNHCSDSCDCLAVGAGSTSDLRFFFNL